MCSEAIVFNTRDGPERVLVTHVVADGRNFPEVLHFGVVTEAKRDTLLLSHVIRMPRPSLAKRSARGG